MQDGSHVRVTRASEWDDINVDLTPRETVIEFLAHAFPVQLQEPFADDEGNIMSRPVFDGDGNPVICQEAAQRRDALIEKLASLPPVPSALDQIVQHFGHDAVAEVTGRSRRVLKVTDARGERLALRSRPASANLAETAAFMDGTKRILVFSMAGGTGRSYHADLACGNTERRIHYLLEPGWRADQAIQGLGRTHRTHQASAPLFRPVATDVKGERRFIATIARRPCPTNPTSVSCRPITSRPMCSRSASSSKVSPATSRPPSSRSTSTTRSPSATS